MTNDSEPPEELMRRRRKAFRKWLNDLKAAAWEEGWRAGNDHGSRMYEAFAKQLDDMDTSVNSMGNNPYRRSE